MHARTDGFTSLGVLFGAGGVALGFPLADPIIGLLITLILGFGITRADIAAFTAAQVDDARYIGAAPAISN